MIRKILLVTERRADYSRFKPILEILKKDQRFDFRLIVTGLHLLEEGGMTKNEILNDGFEISYTFEMFKPDEVDSSGNMVRSLAKILHEITYAIEDYNPDIILSGFDIAANFAITIAGAHMNIPVAHIQGGEVTGTIDESIRHALSKFSHYHFAGNQDAVERLIKMGEEPDKIFNVGCPSIDALLAETDNPSILSKYNLDKDFLIVLQHPVTTESNQSLDQINTTLSAINKFGMDTLFILPNNDTGFLNISKKIKESGMKYVYSLSLNDYVNLLKRTKALVGNSSSGIHETNIFEIPTINIGSRQAGRFKSNNVIDVAHDDEEILEALNSIDSVRELNIKKPYGEGDSAKKIIEILADIDISQNVIQKQITY